MKKIAMLLLALVTVLPAMPPRAPGQGPATCIVGPPREQPKDLGRRASIETCVILVQFTDNRADTIRRRPACFDSMFYSTGVYTGQPYRQGSLNDFFRENSYQLTDVRGGICGNRWFLSNRTYSYYYDGNYMLSTGYQLARDAVALADATVDFRQYDLDNDNHLDGVFVVHAGPGGEDTGNTNHCWSHAIPSFNYTTADGVIIDGATNVPEINLVTSSLDTTLCCIGVMCHELGHVVGLPDLYDGSRNTWGVGYWSLMGYGAWGAGGNTPWSPSHADAWCKRRVNWQTLTSITTNTFGLRILDNETHSAAYRVWRNGIVGDTFFVLENRQNKGFDSPLPGHGLLIWHIDPRYGGTYHNVVDLEEADGEEDLEHGWGYRPDPHYYHDTLGDSGDPFPGAHVNRLFDNNSFPNSKNNYGAATNVTVRNIYEIGDTIICDVLINSVEVEEALAPPSGVIRAEPNPFRTATSISLQPGGEGRGVKIYDAAGRLLRYFSLLPTTRFLIWDGTDQFGHSVPAGIYFLAVEADQKTAIRKVVKTE